MSRTDFETRRATLADAALIVAHRRAMFDAMAIASPDVLDEMTRHFEPWILPRLADGRYFGWITTQHDRPIASAGSLLLDWPPLPRDPTGSLRGYILNVFVEAGFRRRGLARSLIAKCIEEARSRNIGVLTLHASEEGRPLYESLGFNPSNEMMFIDSTPRTALIPLSRSLP